MKPTLITNVEFNSEGDMRDLFSSQELTAIEVRNELLSRARAGEKLVAIVPGEVPRALVMKSELDSSLKGSAEGDELVPRNFG